MRIIVKRKTEVIIEEWDTNSYAFEFLATYISKKFMKKEDVTLNMEFDHDYVPPAEGGRLA